MKKLLAPVAALVLLFACSGCVTNSLPKIINALAKDTNSVSVKITGWGVNVELLRNGGSVAPTTSGFSVTPTTTLTVQPTK